MGCIKLMKVEWEEVEQTHSGCLYRAEVPGGWLWRWCDDVEHYFEDGRTDTGHTWNNSITFQPKEPTRPFPP